MIQGQNLSYSYPDGQRIQFPDFNFEQGSQWLILGASGSGKTTLLQLLAGLRKPSSGSLQMDNLHMEQLSESDLDAHRGKKIGIVFQTGHFVESLTAGDNLLLSQYLAGQKQDAAHCKKILSELGIENKWGKKPKNLSQGERQRLSLARALVKAPEIILADEPSSALDDKNTTKVIDLMKNMAKEVGATLVIVTHDQRLKENFSQTIELQ